MSREIFFESVQKMLPHDFLKICFVCDTALDTPGNTCYTIIGMKKGRQLQKRYEPMKELYIDIMEKAVNVYKKARIVRYINEVERDGLAYKERISG